MNNGLFILNSSQELGSDSEPKHTDMLAMLAIPADISCRELISFINPA